jgi:hypothetical protein
MATAALKKPAGKPEQGIRVVTRSGKEFRRAGLVFGADERTVSLVDITAEQLEAIRSEAMLFVVDVDLTPAAPAKK